LKHQQITGIQQIRQRGESDCHAKHHPPIQVQQTTGAALRQGLLGDQFRREFDSENRTTAWLGR